MPHIFELLGYALIPAVAMILGGAWAIWRPPNENWRSAFLHFAAGLIFAVLSVEFLPDLLHEHSALITGIGFALGTMTMLAVRQLSEKGREKTSQDGEGVSQGLIVASAVDIAVDGLMLGIGFAAGAKQGLLLILALTFEMITLGLAIALELQQGRKSRGSILRNVIALAAVLVISAGLGWLGLSFNYW